MNGLSFAQDADGNWGYKVGADAVIPFNSNKGEYYIIFFTSSDTNPAGYTIIYKDGNISEIPFQYNSPQINEIGNGYVTFSYSDYVGNLTVVKDCYVDGVMRTKGEYLFKNVPAPNLSNYRFTIHPIMVS